MLFSLLWCWACGCDVVLVVVLRNDNGGIERARDHALLLYMQTNESLGHFSAYTSK